MTGTQITKWLNAVSRAQKRRQVSFWGRDYFVTPLLCSTVFGDGKKLMAIQPLATRPRRYLVRVDSQTDTRTDEWFDTLEDIQDAIEDDFGPREWTDDRGRERISHWPSPDWGCGVSWWDVADF